MYAAAFASKPITFGSATNDYGGRTRSRVPSDDEFDEEDRDAADDDGNGNGNDNGNGSTKQESPTTKKTLRQRNVVSIAEDRMAQKNNLHRRFFAIVNEMKILINDPNGLQTMNQSKLHRELDTAGLAGEGTLSATVAAPKQAAIMTAMQLFRPNGPRLLTWDCVTIAAILYSVFDVPLRIGFFVAKIDTPGELAWNYAVTAIFFADMLVTFNVPYYKEKIDAFIVDRRAIALKYMQIWFWIDLVAALPFEAMIGNNSDLRTVKLIRIVRLTRLGKLHKLTKFGAVRDFLDNRNISPAFMNIVTLTLQLAVLAHLIACFWYFLTTQIATGVNQNDDPTVPYAIETWAVTTGYQYASVSSQYIASLYFTFTTLFTVGYGDIHATNTGERLYVVLVEFTAAITFAALIGRVKAVVDSQNLQEKSLRTKMEDFKAYLEEKNVNATLRSVAKDAYAYYLSKVRAHKASTKEVRWSPSLT